jgi:hypothetical protein
VQRCYDKALAIGLKGYAKLYVFPCETFTRSHPLVLIEILLVAEKFIYIYYFSMMVDIYGYLLFGRLFFETPRLVFQAILNFWNWTYRVSFVWVMNRFTSRLKHCFLICYCASFIFSCRPCLPWKKNSVPLDADVSENSCYKNNCPTAHCSLVIFYCASSIFSCWQGLL